MTLMLAGCAGSEEDLNSDQSLSGWYCLMCAGIDVQSTIEAHKETVTVKPSIINKPEK